MKLKTLPDTKTGSPFQWGKNWFVETFSPLSGERLHGPYRTRKRARWAQHGLKKRNIGTSILHERRFWQ